MLLPPSSQLVPFVVLDALLGLAVLDVFIRNFIEVRPNG